MVSKRIPVERLPLESFDALMSALDALIAKLDALGASQQELKACHETAALIRLATNVATEWQVLQAKATRYFGRDRK